MTQTYQVLARKYRPQKFHDVVAQTAIVTTLKNAILHKRVAHAYLFCGTRGTGKTTLARLFAKALNCAHLTDEGEPCNACLSCKEIAAGHALDVLEIDGASHRGIEDIRQINETIGFSASKGHYKIYLIDEVHMLTKEAFNALLKTLEEPPAHVKFFFCTTEPHKLPSTILSRCQRFNLRRIPSEKLRDHLAHIGEQVGLAIDRGALELIAQRADGSLRDALSLLDQVIAFEKSEISAAVVSEILGLPPRDLFFSLDEAGEKGDLTAPFRIIEEVYSGGHNLSYFLEELTEHFRLLFLAKQGMTTSLPEQKLPLYQTNAKKYRTDQLIQVLEFALQAQQQLKFAPSEKVALEILLLRILNTHKQVSLESLVERLEGLEGRTQTMPSKQSLEPPKPEQKAPGQSSPLSASEVARPKSTREASKLPEGEGEKPQAQVKNSAPPKPTPQVAAPLSLQEQSRHDTVIRFAAKELNGVFKPK